MRRLKLSRRTGLPGYRPLPTERQKAPGELDAQAWTSQEVAVVLSGSENVTLERDGVSAVPRGVEISIWRLSGRTDPRAHLSCFCTMHYRQFRLTAFFGVWVDVLGICLGVISVERYLLPLLCLMLHVTLTTSESVWAWVLSLFTHSTTAFDGFACL
jgi:hypothetical protein